METSDVADHEMTSHTTSHEMVSHMAGHEASTFHPRPLASDDGRPVHRCRGNRDGVTRRAVIHNHDR